MPMSPPEDIEQFEMNVNIGGQRMTLHADLNTDPSIAARKFMRANNLDDKFLGTLVEVISDQQRQIREQQEWFDHYNFRVPK